MARSGSALLRFPLDAHPDLAYPRERAARVVLDKIVRDGCRPTARDEAARRGVTIHVAIDLIHVLE